MCPTFAIGRHRETKTKEHGICCTRLVSVSHEISGGWMKATIPRELIKPVPLYKRNSFPLSWEEGIDGYLCAYYHTRANYGLQPPSVLQEPNSFHWLSYLKLPPSQKRPPCCSIIIVTLHLLQCTSCLAVSEHVCVSVSFSLFLLVIPLFVYTSCFPTPSPLSSPDQAQSTCHLLSTTFSLCSRSFQMPLAFLSLVSAIKTSA